MLGPKAMVSAKRFLAKTAGSAGGGMDSKLAGGSAANLIKTSLLYSPEALTHAIVLKSPIVCVHYPQRSTGRSKANAKKHGEHGSWFVPPRPCQLWLKGVDRSAETHEHQQFSTKHGLRLFMYTKAL